MDTDGLAHNIPTHNLRLAMHQYLNNLLFINDSNNVEFSGEHLHNSVETPFHGYPDHEVPFEPSKLLSPHGISFNHPISSFHGHEPLRGPYAPSFEQYIQPDIGHHGPILNHHEPIFNEGFGGHHEPVLNQGFGGHHEPILNEEFGGHHEPIVNYNQGFGGKHKHKHGHKLGHHQSSGLGDTLGHYGQMLGHHGHKLAHHFSKHFGHHKPFSGLDSGLGNLFDFGGFGGYGIGDAIQSLGSINTRKLHRKFNRKLHKFLKPLYRIF